MALNRDICPAMTEEEFQHILRNPNPAFNGIREYQARLYAGEITDCDLRHESTFNQWVRDHVALMDVSGGS